MKPVFFLMCCAALAACGIDGEPVTPQTSANVTLSSSGARLGGMVGLSQGPLTLSLGL